MVNIPLFHHFILTRFNLPLWKENKHGDAINRDVWLEERLNLFENYCLPSVMGQTSSDYTWVLLCDENTPAKYRERIKNYKEQCPQIELIQVEEGYAWDFPRIFSDVVTSILEERGASEGDICLSTQLDNDDALHNDYVSTVQRCVETMLQESQCANDKETGWLSSSNGGEWQKGRGFFLSFDYGLQFYSDSNMATRVKYPNNHFMTCVERVAKEDSSSANLLPLICVYGYGSHFLLEKYRSASVHHITDKDRPMWCEVIHRSNVDNDVKMTIDTGIIRDTHTLQRDFSIDVCLQNHPVSFIFRSIGQIIRRTKGKFIKRKWR